LRTKKKDYPETWAALGEKLKVQRVFFIPWSVLGQAGGAAEVGLRFIPVLSSFDFKSNNGKTGEVGGQRTF